MRVNEDYTIWNAAAQILDDKSVHSFWKKALAIRKQYDVLVRLLSLFIHHFILFLKKIYGDFEDISEGHSQVFAYTRTLGASKILVVLNFKEKEVDFQLKINELEEGRTKLELILGNYEVKEEALIHLHGATTLHLKAYEGRVYNHFVVDS